MRELIGELNLYTEMGEMFPGGAGGDTPWTKGLLRVLPEGKKGTVCFRKRIKEEKGTLAGTSDWGGMSRVLAEGKNEKKSRGEHGNRETKRAPGERKDPEYYWGRKKTDAENQCPTMTGRI